MKLYLRYFTIHLKSCMQYKTSFFLSLIGQFLVSFNVFLGIYFMFRRFHSVAGFSYNEVLLCFSIFLMEFALAETFARGFDSFSSIISNGEFDRIMVRPRNEMLQVLGSKIEFNRIGRMIQCIVMFVYAISKNEMEWTLLKILTLLFMLIGGCMVFTGLFIIYATLCFFSTESLEFMNILTDGAREYGKYPMNIYGKRILQFCTYIVPFALIQYYPLLYLLDKKVSKWAPVFPLIAGIFVVPCYLLWKFGVSHYKSTGS